MAALHSLPGLAARSFSGRAAASAGRAQDAGRQRSLSDSLLAEGSQLSDAPPLAAVPAEKSNRSSTAALTSISIVVGAGVQPSSQSMPNLGADKAGKAAACLGKPVPAGQHTGSGYACGVPAAATAALAGGERRACPQEAARAPAPAAPAAPAAAVAAGQHPSQRLSVASRHLSVLSGGTAQRSVSFQARPCWLPCPVPSRAQHPPPPPLHASLWPQLRWADRCTLPALSSVRQKETRLPALPAPWMQAPSLLSLRSARAPPPLAALLDLEAPPPPARPRQRRTSIAQVRPHACAAGWAPLPGGALCVQHRRPAWAARHRVGRVHRACEQGLVPAQSPLTHTRMHTMLLFA